MPLVRKFCVLLLLAIFFSCSRSHTVVGFWRSEPSSSIPTGLADNTAHSYQIMEFSKDGSVHITNIMKGPTGQELSIPVNGTYKVINSTNMLLEIAPMSNRPSDKLPFNVSYSVSGDVLQFEKYDMSRELVKYTRMKQR